MALVVACSAAKTRSVVGDEQDASAAIADSDEPNFNQGGDSGGTAKPLEPLGNLTGTVFAPNGTLPMSGALIYLTNVKPAAIPSVAFCDKCVELNGADSTLSKPDGTFKLNFFQTGEQYIVVQKGAFRRVRSINVMAGTTAVDNDLTTLPPRTQGDDTAPRMAVVTPTYDHIEKTLEKLGITQVDMIDEDDADAFVKSSAKLSKYHVVFIPCGAGGEGGCASDRNSATATKTALRTFVQGGGRLYATDFAYEYVHGTWPAQVTWNNSFGSDGRWGADAASGRGMACGSSWTGTAKFLDPGLKSWMAVPSVNGPGAVSLIGNWSSMVKVNTVTGVDETGASARLTPTVWAQGQRSGAYEPTTVSFQDKCGRVLFSTYHSEGGTTLDAQEKALLYILLEVNTCVGTPGQPG